MEAHSYEADKRVRDIQRATRRQFSAEEKRERDTVRRAKTDGLNGG
jgi:hypothetical protein